MTQWTDRTGLIHLNAQEGEPVNATTQTLIPAIKDMRTAASLLSNITRKYGDRPGVIKMLAAELANLALSEAGAQEKMLAKGLASSIAGRME